jgi:hypothetical protein
MSPIGVLHGPNALLEVVLLDQQVLTFVVTMQFNATIAMQRPLNLTI